MADTPTTQRDEDQLTQASQPVTWALDSWASALAAPSQNPQFLEQAKAAYDAQHDVSWDERTSAELAELTERAERITSGHAGRNARERLSEFNPDAELGAWAMENTLQNTPEFLEAAKTDYDSIHGAGAWDAHVEKTYQELQDDAEGWDFFGRAEDRLEEFNPNQMLADWGRTHILSQQSALDWSNAAAFGLNGDVFKGLDGQNPVPDETMYDQSTEFGQAWLNASEILYNAKNGENAWAERVADKGWDTDKAAQELAEEGESYVSWFESNLLSAGRGLNLSEDGQVAMVYLMSLNGFTESTWGDLGGNLWRGAADPTFIAATAAGAFTFGAGGVAAHGGRIAAQQGIMHGIKQIMVSRTATAAMARGATTALGEGLVSGAALGSAEQKLAVDNDIRDGYDTGAIFVRSVTEGVAGAGFGAVLSGGGRAIANRVDFSSMSGKIRNFIGAKNGDVSADFQRFQTLTREAGEAKEAGDTAALQNIGDGYDTLLRDGKLSADERTLVESELAGIHAATNPARNSAAPDAAADALATPTPEARTNTAADTPAAPAPNTRTVTPEQQRANLDAMADQRIRAEAMSSQERQASGDKQFQQQPPSKADPDKGDTGNASSNGNTPPTPPEPKAATTPRKPNGWNKGALSEQEKAAFITSIDDTTARNAFINKLNPVERNTLMSQLPDGDILGYVNAMSDVNARSRLIQNLPAGKREDVLDALDVSSRLDGGQPTAKSTAPEADATTRADNTPRQDAAEAEASQPEPNATSDANNTRTDGADAGGTTTSTKADTETPEKGGLLSRFKNVRNWFSRTKPEEAKAKTEANTAKNPEGTSADANAPKEAKTITESFESLLASRPELDAKWKESGFPPRKIDPKDILELYRDLDDAINNKKLSTAKREALAKNAANTINVAVQQGWSPEETQRLIFKSRVAGLRHDMMKHISGSGNDTLHNKMMGYGGYRTHLYENFVRPLLVVDGAAGIRADKFLFKMDGFTPGAKSGLHMRSNLELLARDAISLKLFIPRAFGYHAHPQSMATLHKNIGYMFGRHFNDEGEVKYSLKHSLINGALNGSTFGFHRYSDKFDVLGPWMKGIGTSALLAAGTYSAVDAWDGERDMPLSWIGAPSHFMMTEVGIPLSSAGLAIGAADSALYNGFAFGVNKTEPFGWSPDLPYRWDGTETIDSDMFTREHWETVYPDTFGDGADAEKDTGAHLPQFRTGTDTRAGAGDESTERIAQNNADSQTNDEAKTETPDETTTLAEEQTTEQPSGTSAGDSSTDNTREKTADTKFSVDKSMLPVTVQNLLTRDNKAMVGQAANSAGGFLSGIATSAMGFFRKLPDMLGPTWGPVAGVAIAGASAWFGWGILKGIANFLTGGGLKKLGITAALAMGGLYAFEHFSGARDDHNNQQDRDARLRDTGPLTTTGAAPKREVGGSTMQRDPNFDYKGAFDAIGNKTVSLSETCVGQGSCENLPYNNIELLAQQPETLALTQVANTSFNGRQTDIANDFVINDDFRATGHDSMMADTMIVSTDATGTRGIANFTDISLNGMASAAEEEYTFAAAQNGLGFNGAQITGGTSAATGTNNLPNELSAMINNPTAIRFDNTAHEKEQAVAANGWSTDQFTPDKPALQNAPHEDQPISFNSLA